ncbi:MAG: hypothetical protein LBE76_04860 [Nitrososphaerota archaeon]|jgi:uncharacterized C2H2 Zn-finger protein|nr:hypothetical protein [Nitrososphaerota archaeon]
MTIPTGKDKYLKCPYCACIFFTQTDLESHIKQFGNNPAQHVKEHKEINTKIEYGYGVDE